VECAGRRRAFNKAFRTVVGADDVETLRVTGRERARMEDAATARLERRRD
jgi:hypothetical protein